MWNRKEPGYPVKHNPSGLPWEGYYFSAYGIAVKHGFRGTEEEWLDSLRGDGIYNLRRLGDYVYEIAFRDFPGYTPGDFPLGACSSYVQGGKLYRNLDWDYSELASFRVICPGYTGMAYLPGLTDTDLSSDILRQLPFRVVDGVNDHGIMVSTHVLFNDWHWRGSGDIPLTELVHLILTNVKSMATLDSDLADIVPNLCSIPALDAMEYLAQFLVTDGTTTKAILPPESETGSYVIVDITSNPKLTNFRWVADATVEREDLQTRPTGVERFNLMPCALSELRFTKAYESPDRLSEFIGLRGTTKDSSDEELEDIYDAARAIYLDRRRDGQTWQTMHSVVYSSAGMEHLWVQENWERDYAGTSGGGASSWNDLSGKPFDTIGDGLSVENGALKTTGGGTSWDELAGKPFKTIGSGLTVVNDELQTTGGGGGMPPAGANGTALIAVNGEWVNQTGYAYRNNYTVTWDGDTTGLTELPYGGVNYYKITDDTFTINDVSDPVTGVIIRQDAPVPFSYAKSQFQNIGSIGFNIMGYALVIHSGAEAEHGVYLPKLAETTYVSALTLVSTPITMSPDLLPARLSFEDGKLMQGGLDVTDAVKAALGIE